MVSYKRMGLLASVWMFLMTIFSQFALANGVKDVFQDIATMQWLDWLGLSTVTDPVEGLIRTLLLIALFSLFFQLAQGLKLGKNVAISLALLISLISIIFIPSAILLAAATALGTLFGVLLLIVPLGTLFMAYRFFSENPLMRAFVLFVQAYVLGYMVPYLTGNTFLDFFEAPTNLVTGAGSTYGPLLTGFESTLVAVFWLTVVLMVLELFKAIPSGKADGESFLSGWWKQKKADHLNKRDALVPKKLKRERRKAQRAKTSLLNEYIEEKKEYSLIGDAQEKLRNFQSYIDIAKKKGIESKDEFTGPWKELDQSLRDALKEMKNLKRDTFRERRDLNNLMSELKDLGLPDKDIQKVKAAENKLLQLHDQIQKGLEKIEHEVSSNGRVGAVVEKVGKLKSYPLKLDNEYAFLDKGKMKVSGILNILQQGKVKVSLELENVRKMQSQSYAYSQRLIAKFEEYWEWKKPEDFE